MTFIYRVAPLALALVIGTAISVLTVDRWREAAIQLVASQNWHGLLMLVMLMLFYLELVVSVFGLMGCCWNVVKKKRAEHEEVFLTTRWYYAIVAGIGIGLFVMVMFAPWLSASPFGKGYMPTGRDLALMGLLAGLGFGFAFFPVWPQSSLKVEPEPGRLRGKGCY